MVAAWSFVLDMYRMFQACGLIFFDLIIFHLLVFAFFNNGFETFTLSRGSSFFFERVDAGDRNLSP